MRLRPQPALVAAIEKVVARGGLEIPPDRLFEMEASEMDTGQTLFVFGREMGHYVRKNTIRIDPMSW